MTRASAEPEGVKEGKRRDRSAPRVALLLGRPPTASSGCAAGLERMSATTVIVLPKGHVRKLAAEEQSDEAQWAVKGTRKSVKKGVRPKPISSARTPPRHLRRKMFSSTSASSTVPSR